MKDIEIVSTDFDIVKILKYSSFTDHRGYFTEHFRESQITSLPGMTKFKIVQTNESFSKKGTLRGFHFQWNPYMGKLVRCVHGHLIDFIVDIRIDSPTFGKIIGVELEQNENSTSSKWIWIPPGFAHGCLFLEDSTIEYFCTGEYSGGWGCEAGISPFADDLDWSLCNKSFKEIFDNYVRNDSFLITEKDAHGYTLERWLETSQSKQFKYISNDIPQTIESNEVLVTGGSGLLGGELKGILNADYPTSSEFNLKNYEQMDNYLQNHNYKYMIHCAALSPPRKVEEDNMEGILVNIEGTSKITRLCEKYDIKLIYISTDYVFSGKKGNYSENDEMLPVNKYAFSKLGGECAVRLYDNSIIARLTFGPNEFPYSKAYTDQYTSRECVREIAKKVKSLLSFKNFTGVIHLGSSRKSVYEYAKSLGANVEEASISNLTLKVPEDTSLNCGLYDNQLSIYEDNETI